MPRPTLTADESRRREPVWLNMSEAQRRRMSEYAELIEKLQEVYCILEGWGTGDEHQKKMAVTHLDAVNAALEDLEDHGHDFWEERD